MQVANGALPQCLIDVVSASLLDAVTVTFFTTDPVQIISSIFFPKAFATITLTALPSENQTIATQANNTASDRWLQRKGDSIERDSNQKPLPAGFCRFLECGIFAHGFAWAWCYDCGHR